MLFYDLGNEVLFKIIVVILFDKSSTYFMHKKLPFIVAAFMRQVILKEFQIGTCQFRLFLKPQKVKRIHG